jgi:5,10-methylenetetrahydromethanopterin reductase
LQLAYGTPEKNVPIYVAGSGERTLRLAGRVGDGALISGMPADFARAVDYVRQGERETDKPVGSTTLLMWTTVAVDDDREAARAAVRGSVARRALNTFTRLARAGQLDPVDAAPLEALKSTPYNGQTGEAGYAELIPERWIDRFAIAGTPAEVSARLQQAIAAGAQEISMILMGPRTGARGSADQLTRFAETVMRPLQAAASG